MCETERKHIIPKSILPVLTVANNGSVGETFVQGVEFAASSDVSVLIPKKYLNINCLIFIQNIISKQKVMYSYGRKWGIGRMKESLISLPVDGNGEPDWNLMENHIRSLPYSEMI